MCEDQRPYFADVRIGDTVYDMAYGDGKVIESNQEIGDSFMVDFTNRTTLFFTKQGTFAFRPSMSNFNQTLFYSKPIFDLPLPPKRMVKKVIEG